MKNTLKSLAQQLNANGVALDQVPQQGKTAITMAYLDAASLGLVAGDDLMPTNIAQGLANIKTSSLQDFLNLPAMLYLDQVAHSIPTDCLDCCWQNYCRGGAQNGALLNRYSEKNGFNNISVYCDGLQAFYTHIATYLLSHGMTFPELSSALAHDDSPFKQPIQALPTGMKKRQPIKIKVLVEVEN